MQVVNKKVKLSLDGLDGNAYSLLGAFAKRAKREGWTAEEIAAVRKEATSGDYGHLLNTLGDHIQDPIPADWDEDGDEDME